MTTSVPPAAGRRTIASPSRRRLLRTAVAGACLAAGTAAPAPTATAQGARGAANFRARVPALRLGANLERWFPIAADNRARRLGPGWWTELRGAGFDHVRLFVPRFSETGTGPEVLRLFAEAVADANRAGLPVLLGLADMLHESHPWSDAEWAQWEARAELLAAATDPALVALAPLNEPAFSGTATWRPVRDRMLARLRTLAPRHTLAWGGREWCSWRSLLDIAPPPGDGNTIAEVHDYQGGDADAIAHRFGQVVAWRERHGTPVVVSELGGTMATAFDNVPVWADDLRRLLPVLRRLGLPAALWAYTHGGHWRLQLDQSPRPRPEIAAVLGTARR